MNENIDLTKILKNCPGGTHFYTSTHGEVSFFRIDEVSKYPVVFMTSRGGFFSCLPDGRYNEAFCGECIVFPSKDQRDWSKFSAPYYKKEKFDPHTLQKFDKVLIKHDDDITWHVAMFSHLINIYNDITNTTIFVSATIHPTTKFCVPYNDDTKHLVGTTDEAPDYYKYWED